MKLLTLLLVALVVATASGVACPLGVVGDFFDAVAGVDKSFHKKLPCDAAKWNKAILGILGLAATVSVTIAINNTVDAAVALSQPRYNELKRRDKHYKESAELQK